MKNALALVHSKFRSIRAALTLLVLTLLCAAQNAHAALADDLEDAATAGITTVSTSVGVILTAAMGIAIGFLIFKVLRKGANKAG